MFKIIESEKSFKRFIKTIIIILISFEPGTKEWKEFTRAAAAVLPDRLGNSGTAQRNFLIGLFGGGGIALDPASVIYGPMAARAVSGGLASGMMPSVPSMTLPPALPAAAPMIGGYTGGRVPR